MLKFAFSFFLIYSSLFADFKEFVQEMKNKEKYFTDINTSEKAKNDFLGKFNFKNIDSTKQNQEIVNNLKNESDLAVINSLPWVSKNMLNGKYEKEIQDALSKIKQNQESEIKVDTIFYLFTMAQNPKNLFSFISDVDKLNTAEESIKYYGVVQGMLTKEDLDALYKPFEFYEELGSKTIIKMHPHMFKDLMLSRAPAYLFSKCSGGEFQYSTCENKYLVRGDISLHGALEIVVREDKSYQKYLDVLEYRKD